MVAYKKHKYNYKYEYKYKNKDKDDSKQAIKDSRSECGREDFVGHKNQSNANTNTTKKAITNTNINIATGKTSQAITPFHFFDNFNFHH